MSFALIMIMLCIILIGWFVFVGGFITGVIFSKKDSIKSKVCWLISGTITVIILGIMIFINCTL